MSLPKCRVRQVPGRNDDLTELAVAVGVLAPPAQLEEPVPSLSAGLKDWKLWAFAVVAAPAGWAVLTAVMLLAGGAVDGFA